ncbi:MAG: dTMP kinase [Myxococcota bacterium]|nr:dTMP kinase [Myxococcota bacterium]
MNQGLFIVLEGIDGSGTTTQLRRLAEHLGGEGYTVHTTAEPSTWPVGLFIRDVLEKRKSISPKGLALAFATDRLDHLTQEIDPKLQAGAIGLADRYVLSSLAYQSLGAPMDWLLSINSQARAPDLSILLRVPPEVAAKRRAKRNSPEEIFDADQHQRAIAAAYDNIFTEDVFGPKAVVDASGDMEEITSALLGHIQSMLPRVQRVAST